MHTMHMKLPYGNPPPGLMSGIFHQGFDAAQSDTAMTFTQQVGKNLDPPSGWDP